MKKFTIKATGHSVQVIAMENKTLADVLVENGFDCGYTFSISGLTIDRDAINLPISELEQYGLVDGATVFGCNKVANAATAKICGRAVVIESTVKLSDLNLIAKHRPGALTIYEENDGNKNQLFKVFIGDRDSCIDKNGAIFSQANGDGFATVTMVAPNCVEDVKEWVAEELGIALIRLNLIEQHAVNVLGEIAAERQTVENSIQVL